MELIKLLGVLIVIAGFALKLDSILIIFLALITTGIVGGLGVGGLLETIGTNFVANRSMAIFMMILLVTGTLERNGLREAAANLIKKVKSATAGKLIAVYGVLNGLFGAFNVGFGNFGNIFIALCMLFFAFTTIVGWYYFGEVNVRHLFGNGAIKVYAVIVVICVIIGSTLKVDLVWDMADMFNGLMVLPNLIALLGCLAIVRKLTKKSEKSKEK